MNKLHILPVISLISLISLHSMDDHNKSNPQSLLTIWERTNQNDQTIIQLSTAIENGNSRKTEYLLTMNNHNFPHKDMDSLFRILQKKESMINRQLSFPGNLCFLKEQTLTIIQDLIAFGRQKPTKLEKLSQEKTTLAYIRHLLTAKDLQEKFLKQNIDVSVYYNYRLQMYEITYHLQSDRKHTDYIQAPLLQSTKENKSLIPATLKKLCSCRRKAKRN